MKKRKTKVKFDNKPLFTEVKQSTSELLKKFGITENMSKLVMVQNIREYIEKQSNTVRTCNAILLKLGVKANLDNSPRRSRVLAMTAIEEAVKQGTDFDPSTVVPIAEARLLKIERYLGREVVTAQDEKENKPVSKAEQARQIYSENQELSSKEVAKIISEKLKLELSVALNYYYSARRSLTV